mgnify:CR=1 FL=1
MLKFYTFRCIEFEHIDGKFCKSFIFSSHFEHALSLSNTLYGVRGKNSMCSGHSGPNVKNNLPHALCLLREDVYATVLDKFVRLR